MRRFLSLGGACAALLTASPAFAAGFVLEQQNARALGAAFAGAQARPKDVGYSAFNPAAIAGIKGAELSVNATGVWTKTSFDDVDGVLLGVAPVTGPASGRDYDGDALIPNLSFAVPLGGGFSFGLLLYAPYGFKTHFDAASRMRYQAQTSDLLTLDASPMLSFEIAEGFSIGGALRIQKIDLDVTAMIDAGGVAAASLVPGFGPQTSDLPAVFAGDDLAIGFSAGVQAALAPNVRVGVSYQSKIEHEIEGDAAFDLSASAAAQILNGASGLFAPTTFTTDFVTPAILGAGMEIDASDRLTFLLSATHTFWSAFEEVLIVFANPAQPLELMTQDWSGAWSFSAGAEIEAGPATALRAGFMFDETPVNDVFASPRIPDGDRYWATLGATQDFGERLSADLGLAVAFFGPRPIALSGAAPENLFRGALSADMHATAFAVSGRLRYRF